MDEDQTLAFLFGIFIGCLALIVIFGIMGILNSDLSEKTLQDICNNLTNNTASKPSIDIDGRLICEVPSFDHTTNIIIKPAGQIQ